ncbi:MAG: hypothetical protein K5918_04570 [Bacteroidales bacterium]|nr:hypothetical protein [Bacteroidales bacterium]
MSDTYHYEEGAIHNDHKKVLQIGNIGASDVGKLLGAFFSSDIEDAVIDGGDGKELSDSRQAIIDELFALAENGDWVDGITAEDIKGMLTAVLGRGETPLSEEETEMSEELWYMLEHGRGGDRVRVTWQNIIGYLWSKKLIDAKSAPELNKEFFGDKVGSDNINKGRNGRLSKVTPLLDAYVPKLDKKM